MIISRDFGGGRRGDDSDCSRGAPAAVAVAVDVLDVGTRQLELLTNKRLCHVAVANHI